MNVDTDTFSALTAETEMLRQRADRGRHRKPRGRQPWRPADGYWWGGHAMAMHAVIDTAADAAVRTGSASRALADVVALAEGVIRLQDADWVPPQWSGDV